MKILSFFFFLTALCAAKPNLPLLFEENQGRAPAGVQMISAVRGQPVWLTSSGVSFRFLDGATVNLQLPAQKFEGVEEAPVRVNYFVGRDESKWRTNVAAWKKVRSATSWDGIDVVFYGTGQNLEYDFEVAPGADPSKIMMRVNGEESLELTASGDIIVRRGGNLIVQRRPVAFQNGRRVDVAFRLDGNAIRFAVGPYDRSSKLIIDPLVETATYIGGRGYDTAQGVAVDAQGNYYVTGQTNSPAIASPGLSQENLASATDAFVARVSPSGQVQWLTYFGGRGPAATGGGVDIGNSIALDPQGNVYVGGDTTSTDLPTSPNAYQRNFGGGTDDAFVVKLAPGGDRVIYATYLGGGADDFGNGIAVDASGHAYLTGWTRSSDFPVFNALQASIGGGGRDTFLVKIAPSGNALVYGTYVGGNGQDFGTGVAVDSTGAAYVTGSTSSSNFPIINAFQRQGAGGILGDAFVYKVNPQGSGLIFSTLIGGSETDQGYRLALDSSNNVVVSGYTESGNFPTRNAAQRTFGGTTDVFVAKLNAAGNDLIFSTYLGGTGEEFGFGGVALDRSGAVYISGFTASQNFPQISPSQRAFGGGRLDAFAARLAPTGNALLYSTFVGGSGDDRSYGLAVDGAGRALLVGSTSSADFPGVRNRIGTGGNDPFDAFLARLSADTGAGFLSADPVSLTLNVPANSGPVTQTIRLTSAGAAVNYSVLASTPWLIVNPPSGNLPQELTISVDPRLLSPGTQNATITITAAGAGNSPLTIPVTVNVGAQPAITALEPGFVQIGADETVVTVRGSSFLNDARVLVNNTEVGTVFIDASTLRAVIPATFFLTAGSLNIQVRNAGATSPVFSLPVTAGGPTVIAAGVVNAATNLPGVLAPGLVVNVFGAGFGPSTVVPGGLSGNMLGTSISDIRVLIDGQAVPLLYAAPGQIGAVVPFEIAARPSVSLVLESGGQRSAPLAFNVAAAAPGIFTRDSSGRGQIAAINEDGTFNSENTPAARGSVITFYATGAGVTTPASQSGQVSGGDTAGLPRPELPIEVLIGGNPAQVLYIGAAPGLVAGVVQTNVRLPEGVNSGSAIPVVLRVGGVNSRFDATIAIR